MPRYRLVRERPDSALSPVDHWTVRTLRDGQRLSYDGEAWLIRTIEPFEGQGPEPYAGLVRAEPAPPRG